MPTTILFIYTFPFYRQEHHPLAGIAIAAVLALVPHPDDPDSTFPMSVLQRRTYSHKFARLASSAIEAECELELSTTEPGQALSSRRPSVSREKLHAQVPEDLETLLALLILSVYEYSQRGNLLKMRYLAGQALALALDKSLHRHLEEDKFSEARRRAWWMTVCYPSHLTRDTSNSDSSTTVSYKAQLSAQL